MSLVKAKDIPFETLCLEKRLEFVKELKRVLGREQRVVTATVDLYTDLIEDILFDVCLDVHKDIVMGIERETDGKEVEGGRGKGPRPARQRGLRTRSTDRAVVAMENPEEENAEEENAENAEKHETKANEPADLHAMSPRARKRPSATSTRGQTARKRMDKIEGTDRKDSKDQPPTMEELVKEAALHYGSATHLGVQMSGSKGAVDMFGNMIQPVALEQVTCPSCTRKVSSGRFALHLEKCMGGGRQGSRGSTVKYWED